MWLIAFLRSPLPTAVFLSEHERSPFGRRLVITIPLCRPCERSTGRPKPEHVDFDTDRIELPVHQRLYDALRR